VSLFSPRSRKRLLEKFQTLSWPAGHWIFITLTYPAQFPDARLAKRHLDSFFKRLKRRFPQQVVTGFWRLEFQQRGAPHFHLLLFNLPYFPRKELAEIWRQIVGSDKAPFTRIRKCDHWRRAMFYVSKYVAKAGPLGGFNSLPYLTVMGDVINPSTGEILLTSVGRWWGVVGRKFLPVGELFSFVVRDCPILALHQIKRAIRHYWKRANKHAGIGVTVFVTNPLRWLEFMYWCILEYGS
jgi:hypothetical protein